MPHQNARANELLRLRDGRRKARQLWVAGVVVWAVVVGWVVFGFVNSLTDDADVRLTWVLTWLLPVVVLGVGAAISQIRLRRCEAALVASQRPG